MTTVFRECSCRRASWRDVLPGGRAAPPETLRVNRSRIGNTVPITSAVMTTVVRIVAAAIGLQVAVGAAPPQRETAARPAFEAATIKLSTGPSRANIVSQPAPNRRRLSSRAAREWLRRVCAPFRNPFRSKGFKRIA